MTRSRLSLSLLLMAFSLPASAQGVYVAAVAGADTRLTNEFRIAGQQAPHEDGGTAPFAGARIGVALGSRWGAELEAVYRFTSSTTSEDVVSADRFVVGRFLPSIRLRAESEMRVAAFTPSLWLSHPLNNRVDLVVAGGAIFSRTVTELEYDYTLTPIPGGGPFGFGPVIGVGEIPSVAGLLADTSTKAVTYDVGPLAGVDASIAFGDHFRIAPGFRLSGVGPGWSLRPSVALAWWF
jgi:hypothetical protein